MVDPTTPPGGPTIDEDVAWLNTLAVDYPVPKDVTTRGQLRAIASRLSFLAALVRKLGEAVEKATWQQYVGDKVPFAQVVYMDAGHARDLLAALADYRKRDAR